MSTLIDWFLVLLIALLSGIIAAYSLLLIRDFYRLCRSEWWRKHADHD